VTAASCTTNCLAPVVKVGLLLLLHVLFVTAAEVVQSGVWHMWFKCAV
jgi:glyceraldehyde-3-phosphate dehydrogenase/erythrose-4-phosphate dehydrogenase